LPSYKLRIETNHLLAELEGGLALIDTGSRRSYGAGRPFEIGETPYMPTDDAPSLRKISQELGVEVNWLIGNDVLRDWVVMLDWNAGEIRFERSPFEINGTEIPVHLPRGWPLLDISVDGRTVEAVLDSGAQRSYSDPETASTHASIGVADDFHLEYGRFKTQLYRVPLVVGGRAIDVQWGILPDRLHDLLSIARWILGIDFFRERRIAVDLAKGRVVDSP